MAGFLNALSFLAPIAPAQAEAREIRRQRGMENQQFQNEQAQFKTEQSAAQQLAQLRNEEIAQQRQRTRQGTQDVIFGQPEWDSSRGEYTVLALDAGTGKIIRKSVPGGEDPEKDIQRKIANFKVTYKMATGKDPDDENIRDAIFGAYGIKQPTFRAPHIYTDPSTGLAYSVSYDQEGNQVVNPVIGPGGKQLGGLRPTADTVSTGYEMKQDANGEWVKVPVTRTTRKSYDIPQTPSSAPSPSPAPRTAAGVIPGQAKGVIDTGVRGKLSSQDTGLLEGVQQIQTAADRILPILEPYKNRGGLTDRAQAEYSWLQYRAGMRVTDPLYASIIKDVALLGGIGQSQWTRVGRGQYLFNKMSQHLPKPTDTPALLYDKIRWLSDEVANETRKAVMRPAPDSSASDQPGTPVDPAVEQFLMTVGGGNAPQ